MKEREAMALIERHVEQDPSRPGPADARLIQSGVPVWMVAGYIHAAAGDVERVAADYHLPLEAVEAAFVYHLRHKAAIDARLAANAS